MAEGKIEIIENTLLKLLIRRGINADRVNVLLNEGELGYTTDTKKLFIGDGSTLGGILLTGTKFIGATSDLTTLSPGDINDLGYNTVSRQLCYIATGDGSLAADWVPISNLVVDADGTITVDSTSGVKLGNCAGSGLVKDGNNKLEIDDYIYTNVISPKTAPYLTLPQATSFGNVNYTFPTTGVVNSYLRLNESGALTWSPVGGTSNSFVNSEVVTVGTIMAYADSVLPADGRWLLCDGSYVSTVSYPRLSAVIGSKFGSLSTSGGTQYFKLPDLRGKVVMGFTNTLAYDLSGTGMTFAFASSGGEYKHTLLLNEIPAHAHTFLLYGDSSNGTNVQGGSSSYNTGSKTTDSSGGGQPHTNIQPYLALSYIIKAIPDTIATCNIVLESNLSASEVLRGVVSSINPLSGSYTLGLASIIAPTNAGYLSTNQKGQVTSFDATSAGVVNNQGANNTPVTHVYGFVNYLYTPVPAASITLFGTVSSTWSQRVNVYPTLSSSLFGNLATPVVNLPNKAKNVIVEVTAVSTSFSPQYVYSALHRDNLGTGSTRNTREYTLNSGYGGTTQVTIPLSANQNDGTISFAIRGWAPSNNFYQRFEINIIGWTQ